MGSATSGVGSVCASATCCAADSGFSLGVAVCESSTRGEATAGESSAGATGASLAITSGDAVYGSATDSAIAGKGASWDDGSVSITGAFAVVWDSTAPSVCAGAGEATSDFAGTSAAPSVGTGAAAAGFAARARVALRRGAGATSTVSSTVKTFPSRCVDQDSIMMPVCQWYPTKATNVSQISGRAAQRSHNRFQWRMIPRAHVRRGNATSDAPGVRCEGSGGRGSIMPPAWHYHCSTARFPRQ